MVEISLFSRKVRYLLYSFVIIMPVLSPTSRPPYLREKNHQRNPSFGECIGNDPVNSGGGIALWMPTTIPQARERRRPEKRSCTSLIYLKRSVVFHPIPIFRCRSWKKCDRAILRSRHVRLFCRFAQGLPVCEWRCKARFPPCFHPKVEQRFRAPFQPV